VTMISVYTTASTATPAPIAEPERELWLAVSSGEVADDVWFWAPEWQAGEREVDRAIATGDLSSVFSTLEELFADLDDQT
jgi:hypothetical protein